jgi:TonB family protein
MMDLLTLLLDSALRVTVILGVSLGVMFALRHSAAALRHLLLSLAIAGSLLAPVMTFVAPAWRPDFVDRVLPSVQTENAGAADASRASGVTTTESTQLPSLDAARALSEKQESAASAAAGIILPIWIAGVIVFAGILLTGLARLRWLASRSRRVADEEPLAAMVDELASGRGVNRPVTLFWNDRSWLLVTWGFFHPRVMLPAAAAARWSDERLRVVISHELAHVRRGDWITQLAAELLRAVFWFNPLVWIVCRRLRAESELACDDEVLNGGIDGVDYAGHLLDLARVLNTPRHAWLSAPAMARPSSLEGRISAMLNAGLNRHPVSRAARAVTGALVLGLTLAVAGFAQSTFYSLSGTVVDSTDRVVPGAELTLTNPASGARYSIKSDASGRFEFIGLPSGDYGVEVLKPGFKAAKEMVPIASGNVTNRRIALQIGTLTETISVRGSGGGPATRVGDEAGLAAERQKVVNGCKPNASNTGGDITPPHKLVHVAPVYPAELAAAKIGGIVSMEAMLDTDGDVQDVTVVASPDPGLATAAVESVKQWKYTPALLNCAPIDVRVGVTVSFAPKQ